MAGDGLYVGPAVSGHEPKYQRLGVNALFGALILVVGGSLAGEWLGIQQRLGNMWFWFGSQGYEYVDLGASGRFCCSSASFCGSS